MKTVFPDWIDQVQGVDFTPEKGLLSELEQWAAERGWEVSDGSSLPSELRQRTDVLLSRPGEGRYFRISVLPKSRGSSGQIRLDATSHEPFSHRIFELIYQSNKKRWRVEVSTVPLADDIRQVGWDWLEDLAFRQ
ncbi:MAG: hypothetical protein ACK47B_06925 [Armatimonadota bacterium]